MAGGFFGALAPWIIQQLAGVGFEQKTIPSKWAWREGATGAAITSWLAEATTGESLRAAWIQSPRVEVFNAMLYPSVAFEMPVLACELLVLGAKPVVAVVDLQDPAGNTTPAAQRWGSKLQAEIGHLKNGLTDGGVLPEWALEHFSVGCLYARPATFDELPMVCDAVRRAVALWIRERKAVRRKPDYEMSDLAYYKRHHVENVPALSYLKKIFGESWAERYMHDFLYV